MEGLWKGFVIGVRTLFSHPIQYLTNPVEAVTDTYRDDLSEAGLGEGEIEDRIVDFKKSGGVVTDVGELYGSATTAVGDAFKSVSGILKFFGKNFTLVLIVALAVVAAWYFLMFKKAVT